LTSRSKFPADKAALPTKILNTAPQLAVTTIKAQKNLTSQIAVSRELGKMIVRMLLDIMLLR